MLTCDNLSAGYGATVVLDHVSFTVEPGTTLAVLGRNGVGKTTLLATILGHTTRHDGTITFAEPIIGGLKPFRRARLGLGFVPQEREIFPSLTVEENLTVAARPPPTARMPGHWNASTPCSPISPSAAAAWATNSRAGSSRCSRSAAR